jgi:uncharacterized protein (TIGR02284 family)
MTTDEIDTIPFDTINGLQGLISISKDCADEFREAAARIHDDNLRERFVMIYRQRREFGLELRHIVSSLGEAPESSKDLAGELRLLWMELRAALTKGDEQAILRECERAEKAARDAYRDVLLDRDLPPEVRPIIERQEEAVRQSHEGIRRLCHGKDPLFVGSR